MCGEIATPKPQSFHRCFYGTEFTGMPDGKDTRSEVSQLHHRLSTLAAEAVKGFDFQNVPEALPKSPDLRASLKGSLRRRLRHRRALGCPAPSIAGTP